MECVAVEPAAVGEATSFKLAGTPASAEEDAGGMSTAESGAVVVIELFLFGLGLGLDARSPVHCIMEPSLRERISVDCTPGRALRCESRAETCCGI